MSNLTQVQKDTYVAGLAFLLVIMSSVPLLSTAAVWLGILLLAIVWFPVIEGKVK